jgi:hypothetical protein
MTTWNNINIMYFSLKSLLWLKNHMLSLAIVKNCSFFNFQINFKLKRGNMRKRFMYQNLFGTLGYNYMKGFYGGLRKAIVMSNFDR